MIRLLFALGTLCSLSLVAAEDPASFAGKPQMNGIAFEQYRDFRSSWHLVTTRFRKDTEEMRLTYANPLAWETLQKGGKDYPEGAVFAKIGIATQADPAFPSSAVPSGARRYQFMVRDKKFKDTDGWAYALFDANGKTFPEEPKLQSLACAACHRLVPDRGFVFSQEWKLDAGREHAAPLAARAWNFENIPLNKLPVTIKKLLPPETKRVWSLKTEMQKHLFQGTLDEIRPTLAQESYRRKEPTLLMSKNGQRFSLMQETGSACEGNGREMLSTISLPDAKKAPIQLRFCQKDAR